ncbi:hypothetical protein B7H17_09890 [Pseudomonas putida]|uniref:Uncharacterized protein n=1 Tax=Pseudomonas putida TaxID=303 RepID=A0A1X0ZZI7_PSEPU|nr:hypothetical protein B7H17_09890 [Pseudomonas putida]
MRLAGADAAQLSVPSALRLERLGLMGIVGARLIRLQIQVHGKKAYQMNAGDQQLPALGDLAQRTVDLWERACPAIKGEALARR